MVNMKNGENVFMIYLDELIIYLCICSYRNYDISFVFNLFNCYVILWEVYVILDCNIIEVFLRFICKLEFNFIFCMKYVGIDLIL